jgi:hypothetical protein
MDKALYANKINKFFKLKLKFLKELLTVLISLNFAKQFTNFVPMIVIKMEDVMEVENVNALMSH